jgi:hypothetical protein
VEKSVSGNRKDPLLFKDGSLTPVLVRRSPRPETVAFFLLARNLGGSRSNESLGLVS